MTPIKIAALAAIATCSVIQAHAAEPAARGEAQRESGKPPHNRGNVVAHPAYDSAFADYRPFAQELGPKDWRRANDEVREAGGHVGLMKGQPAQLTGHGAHGAKQPIPPASPDRK